MVVTPFSLQKDSDFSRMLTPYSYALICRQQAPLKCRYAVKNLIVSRNQRTAVFIFIVEKTLITNSNNFSSQDRQYITARSKTPPLSQPADKG